jgi:hypothetical protein
MHLPILSPTAQRGLVEAITRYELTGMEQIKILHKCFGEAIANGEDLVYAPPIDRAINELVNARPVSHDERVERIVSALVSYFHDQLDDIDNDNEGFCDAKGDLQPIRNNLWNDDGTITVQIGGIPLIITISEAPSI